MSAMLVLGGAVGGDGTGELRSTAVDRSIHAVANTLAPKGVFDGGDGTHPDFPALDSWQVALQTTSLAFICVLALAGNFVVAYTLFKKELLLIPSNKLVFSLTSSNFVLALVVFPFIIASSVQREWMFGIFWCNFTAFVTILVASASVLTVAVIAIDRYYAIVKPLMYNLTVTNARCMLFLIGVWIVSLICALPPIFGWSRFHYKSREATCMADWNANIAYSVVVLILSLLIPLVTMIVCYYLIFQVVRTKCRKIYVGIVGRDIQSPIATRSSTPVPPPLPTWRWSLPHKPSWLVTSPSPLPPLSPVSSYTIPVKGLRTICVVMGIFLTTSLPYVVLVVVETCTGNEHELPSWYRVLSLWLVFASSATHPVVYGVYNRSIRKELRLCVCPYSRSLRGTCGVRPTSQRPSMFVNLMNYSPFRTHASRRSSAVSFDCNKLYSVSRKGSQDSGAVMTESECEAEASTFYLHRNRRRVSAPSRLQQISTIFGCSVAAETNLSPALLASESEGESSGVVRNSSTHRAARLLGESCQMVTDIPETSESVDEKETAAVSLPSLKIELHTNSIDEGLGIV